MSDIDQMLIGTVWTRSSGNHGPVTGTIDQTNQRGPRLKLVTGGHRRLNWAELDLGWSPTDATSTKRYQLWKHAAHIEYLDKQIERETPVMPTTEENGTAVDIEQTKACHGAWHKKRGQYIQVPLSAFDVATRGPNVGKLGAVCRDCARKRNEAGYNTKKPKKGLVVRRVVETFEPLLPKPVEIAPTIDTPEDPTFRWKITVTVSQDHYVQGKDFLDAAAQVSGLGEITRVEKL